MTVPPKPPLLPPGFVRGYGGLLFFDLFGVALNGFLAHGNARADSDIGLFINCMGLAASSAATVLIAIRARETWRDWAGLRRKWDELFKGQ